MFFPKDYWAALEDRDLKSNMIKAVPLRKLAKDVIEKRKLFLDRGDEGLEEVH